MLDHYDSCPVLINTTPVLYFLAQVAPGVPTNRPNPGSLPVRKTTLSKTGHTEFLAETWYEGLERHGNTSINPFFYGTYLGETKPGEPVTRTKYQVFQADAVGVAHQLTASHFNRTHTFRLEWQPGPGGRIDWFSKGYNINETLSMTGDGLGEDWVHAYALHDKSLRDLMGSQIPIEPTYLIMNIAVSSTWGFPYDTPSWCEKCYDCDDPKCACTFYPGFCKMLKNGDIAMYIDSIRVYQSRDPSAHIGANHTLGCDPPDFPTKGYIKGHSYRYMRNPPFVYSDWWGPLRKVATGGGECETDSDCGGDIIDVNLTALAELSEDERRNVENQSQGRGKCMLRADAKFMFSSSSKGGVCNCNAGFTGPNCLAQAHFDEAPSAYDLARKQKLFASVSKLRVTPFMIFILLALLINFVGILAYAVSRKKMLHGSVDVPTLRRPTFQTPDDKDRLITGTSV